MVAEKLLVAVVAENLAVVAEKLAVVVESQATNEQYENKLI